MGSQKLGRPQVANRRAKVGLSLVVPGVGLLDFSVKLLSVGTEEDKDTVAGAAEGLSVGSI